MWPFSKKWTPPEPRVAFVVSLTSAELPSIMKVAIPTGADGAVKGGACPADAKPNAENMTGPMQTGNYLALSPGAGICGLSVERIETPQEPLTFEPAMMEVSGLTDELLAKFNNPVWRVILQMQQPGNDLKETVVFATEIAKRLAALADGVVMDVPAYRFFGPDGWKVKNPIGEFDAREHVHMHVEGGEGVGWFHTHGLVKFGRPELEIYEVPLDLTAVAYATLFDIAQYVITSSMIQPGQTCGDPNQPFHARIGSKHRKGHWEDTAVLELVDVNERRKPVSAGATKALEANAAGS